MTALHRTLSLIALVAAAGCSSAPEPSPTPSDRPVEHTVAEAPAPMGEVVMSPVVESEAPAEQAVEPLFEPVEGPGQPAQAVEVVVVGEVEVADLERAPAELTVDFLQRMHDQIRRDIRHGRMDRARERFATVRGQLDFDSQDPRAGIAGDIELIGGFLDHVAGAPGGSDGGQMPEGAGTKPVK